MIYNEKRVVLKDGKEVVLQSPKTEDASLLLEYINGLSGETPFILRTPEDCTDTVEDEEKFIKNNGESPYNLMISAYYGGKIIANSNLKFNKRSKIAHKCELAIGIRKEFWNLGLGTALMAALEEAAKDFGCKIITLIYIEGNERALRLYTKCGFTEFGRLPCGTKMPDGTYVADVYMAKYL